MSWILSIDVAWFRKSSFCWKFFAAGDWLDSSNYCRTILMLLSDFAKWESNVNEANLVVWVPASKKSNNSSMMSLSEKVSGFYKNKESRSEFPFTLLVIYLFLLLCTYSCTNFLTRFAFSSIVFVKLVNEMLLLVKRR